MPLEPENQRHLIAAQGYVEMDMFLEANGELEEIDAEVRHVPEILEVRVMIYQGLKKWELMEVVAKKLAQYDPGNVQNWISWAYATRRADSLQAARAILLDALDIHPKQSAVLFNLACYECQLEDIESAKSYLQKATKINPNCRLHALEDEDLEPLWKSLRAEVG